MADCNMTINDVDKLYRVIYRRFATLESLDELKREVHELGAEMDDEVSEKVREASELINARVNSILAKFHSFEIEEVPHDEIGYPVVENPDSHTIYITELAEDEYSFWLAMPTASGEIDWVNFDKDLESILVRLDELEHALDEFTETVANTYETKEHASETYEGLGTRISTLESINTIVPCNITIQSGNALRQLGSTTLYDKAAAIYESGYAPTLSNSGDIYVLAYRGSNSFNFTCIQYPGSTGTSMSIDKITLNSDGSYRTDSVKWTVSR